MGNFDYLFDKMTEQYQLLESIMGAVATDQLMTKEQVLEALGTLGQKMLFVQGELTEVYANPNEKSSMMQNLEEKSINLAQNINCSSGLGVTADVHKR